VEEFSILATLRSPFVVYFYGICIEPDMALVMEYCSNGSVYEVLNRKVCVRVCIRET
jgi:serine/threonine protein kinase